MAQGVNFFEEVCMFLDIISSCSFHCCLLQDAAANDLMPFRARRDAPNDGASGDQNKFDPGESFAEKSRDLSQLAMQVCVNITRLHTYTQKHKIDKPSTQNQYNLVI